MSAFPVDRVNTVPYLTTRLFAQPAYTTGIILLSLQARPPANFPACEPFRQNQSHARVGPPFRAPELVISHVRLG